MLKRLSYGACSAFLSAVCAFFVAIVVLLVGSEVLPAVATGTLDVATSTMILNRVWQGNEIYVLLAAYLLVAGVAAFGAYRCAKRAFGKGTGVKQPESGELQTGRASRSRRA